MANPNNITHVGIGETDGYRYVGVEPPLTHIELKDLYDKDIIQPDWLVTQIRDVEPDCTIITVSGDFDDDHPDTRTATAQKVAMEIGKRLGYLRDTGISTDTRPIEIQGHHASPFTPYTDRRRAD